MDNPKTIENGDPLARSMRRQAQHTRPQFSEALHARLRTAICANAPITTQRAAHSRRQLRGELLSWSVAAAAAITIFVGSTLFWHSFPQPDAVIAQSSQTAFEKSPSSDIDDTTALLENTAAEVGQWMATTLDAGQWAGLDRDVETVMTTVTGGLPFDLSLAIADNDSTE